ncbi:ATP-binding cassette domain-containing protein [Wenzhouxiangella sp. XN24]|uniref:ATP-binding cassette domain-containing protein n=1 Tax=Wenzhouxiangella sp. XN24 TaxID=2713569 RepID=UPI0013EBC6A1|nr:ATP-binding cassette domain-containing protein [Wenzhouxiangella sp. XN24]NGX14867.1 ATP-binding cassette domain-containing protein [Wenzhouxiangella sp. XN24]
MLLRFDQVSLRFGDQAILSAADFTIEAGERVCLIGRNGAGKTSLLKLISGSIAPDDGEIQARAGLRVSRLEQDLPDELDSTVRESVMKGLAPVRALVAEYERLAHTELGSHGLSDLEALHRRIDAADGWNVERAVDTLLTEMKLPGDQPLGALSGGWRRRAALARALVSRPDLLLLDEPTNHLDLSSIQWLEQRIVNWPGAVLFITHDRAFLQRLATRIAEIDRGKLVSWPGDYRDYLRRKADAIEEEERQNAEFDRKLAGEEAWVRQGIKARRTRNEGRVRALEALREERAQRVKRPGTARISIGEAESSGRKVLQAKNVSYGYDGKPLITALDLKIMRGDRLGLVGNNGVGKSTLLKLLLGELEPQAGTIKQGTHLEIAYFDQMRQLLEHDKSVAYNVGDGRDHVVVNGKPQHVVGYLGGFLFTAKRALTPVAALSGGERNRVILAKLFTQPSNLLVLDEPTNDLDVETLEVLEARLAEYAGTLLVVSHDREFLDNVVNRILVFEAGGQLVEYVGGYSDWVRRGRELAEMEAPAEAMSSEGAAPRPGATPAEAPGGSGRPARTAHKLGYREQRELDALPGRIDALEDEIAALEARMAAPEFYAQPWELTQPVIDALARKQAEHDRLTNQWLALEERRAALAAGRER